MNVQGQRGGEALVEQALVEFGQWLGRALQYSLGHALSGQLAARAHQTLSRALSQTGGVEIGVLKDNLLVGDVPCTHPIVRTRLAPALHERGVLSVRMVPGVSLDELSALMGLLTTAPVEVFQAGGVRLALAQRGVARLQVDEIVHDITAEEREQIKRQNRMRDYFRDLLANVLARRPTTTELRERLVELLEHPDLVAQMIQTEPHVNLAEAIAAFTLVVQQEERRTGVDLIEKMRAVACLLSPEARDKVLLGLPPLVGELRHALLALLDGMDEARLARFAFPSVRARSADLEPVLYALGVALPSDHRRVEVVRRAAHMLFDLPLDEAATHDALAALAQPPDASASFYAERACVVAAAARILETRAPLIPSARDGAPADAFDTDATLRLARDAAREVIGRASYMVDFDRMCAELTRAASARGGELEAEDGARTVGLLLGLANVGEPRWRDVAAQTLAAIARSPAGAAAMRAAERMAGAQEGEHMDEIVQIARLLVPHDAEPVVDLLARSENRKLRRVLLELLPQAGPALLPCVRGRLHAAEWFVARNMILLFARARGPASDLESFSRHPHLQVRLEAVRALRELRDDAMAAEILVSFVSDPSEEVQSAALLALQSTALGARAIEGLERVAMSEAFTDKARRAAVEALGRSRSDAAADALFRLMQPRGLLEMPTTSALRDEIARALRTSPAGRAAARFAEGLQSTAWRVRKACERANGERRA